MPWLLAYVVILSILEKITMLLRQLQHCTVYVPIGKGCHNVIVMLSDQFRQSHDKDKRVSKLSYYFL